MGKLLGLPMGCDVCYTNHAEADQNSADNLLMLLAAAGCNYFMGVPVRRRRHAELPVHALSRRQRPAAALRTCGRRRNSQRGSMNPNCPQWHPAVANQSEPPFD